VLRPPPPPLQQRPLSPLLLPPRQRADQRRVRGAPEPGIFSEEFLYYYDSENQPLSYLAHSNQISTDQRVLVPPLHVK
jgi:hypothetical protein